MDEIHGVPLQQALEKYADRERWLAFCSATARKREHQYHQGSLWITTRRVNEWEDCDDIDESFTACERAERAVVGDLWMRLYSGELIATGIECPPRLDSERRKIAPHMFRILSPRFGESSLVGPDIKIVDVLIRPALEGGPIIEQEKTNALLGAVAAATSAKHSAEAEIRIPTRGKPGRPRLPPDFGREMQRHAEAGELCAYLTHEALYLQAWGIRNGLLNNGAPWALKTIKNNLNRLYRLLAAQKSGPK